MSNLIDLILSIPAGIGMLTGATIGLVCYALSIPLSPFIVGSITTVVSAAFVSVSLIWVGTVFSGESLDSKRDSIVLFSHLFFPQLVIGIGLSAAINAIPGITLDINSATSLGAIIGLAVPILTVLAMIYLPPIVEKVKGSLSSQEKNSDTHTIEESDKPSNTLESLDPSEIKGEDKNLVAAKT